MKKSITRTPQSEEDAYETYRYIALDSVEAAEAYFDALFDTFIGFLNIRKWERWSRRRKENFMDCGSYRFLQNFGNTWFSTYQKKKAFTSYEYSTVLEILNLYLPMNKRRNT